MPPAGQGLGATGRYGHGKGDTSDAGAGRSRGGRYSGLPSIGTLAVAIEPTQRPGPRKRSQKRTSRSRGAAEQPFRIAVYAGRFGGTPEPGEPPMMADGHALRVLDQSATVARMSSMLTSPQLVEQQLQRTPPKNRNGATSPRTHAVADKLRTGGSAP